MRLFTLSVTCLFVTLSLHAQQGLPANDENIYRIKEQFMKNVLHNPADQNKSGEDNDLERFNRWFHFAEPRCYPSGNMPRPDVLLREYEKAQVAHEAHRGTTADTITWQPLGPTNVPPGFFGIGRINTIVVNPLDTNTLYVGAACGGVWISHDAGHTWTSNSDKFPSLSVADIAVNPKHPDTLYAATGDGYGYESPAGLTIFWGGLYTAGVMKSTDGGNSWHTTGLSYVQSNRDMIQKLLVHPTKTNILLAATRHGIYRSADAGGSWTQVDTGHVFSMAFRPQRPDTIYAINTIDLRASYDAGLTWHTINSAINLMGDRCSIAVSAAAPNNVWVLDASNLLLLSTDGGNNFNLAGTPSAFFYGYYDRVLGVSPSNPNLICALGSNPSFTINGGSGWNSLDPFDSVHPDYHAIAFNPAHPQTIYAGNDGGIWVTHNNGNTWKNLSNGLMISQIYKMASSRQNPNIMLCGLQDNATFYNNGTGWVISNAPFGDGMACAIHPLNDSVQIGSTQNGNFAVSTDRGDNFTPVAMTGTGAWTAPVVFHPRNPDTIYFGLTDIWASYDRGWSAINLTLSMPFNGGSQPGAVALAISPSNPQVLYAADFGSMLSTTDGGNFWNAITADFILDSVAVTNLAVDYKNPSIVYVTTSGYVAGSKVFVSTDGGDHWNNITATGLPNMPVNCIAIDSSNRNALYVGTDMGVYYKDSTQASWTLYANGLPDVIVNDLEINYTNRKLRAATYGRGIWQTGLKKTPVGITDITTTASAVSLYPNPATDHWKIVFGNQKPANFTVRLSDIGGRVLRTMQNTVTIDAAKLASGVYHIEIADGDHQYTLKAVKK